ncbi:hypothetical protein BZA77DRAFT_137290 [Pyronema omphalodes]|nr:hypothetical protein BZA77DRAFT_137290 [Pyronema omphalodes]
MPPPSSPRQLSSRGASSAGNTSQNRPQILKERENSRRTNAGFVATRQLPEVQYTVYVRLPFNRNGFIDPPRVDWDTSKDQYVKQMLPTVMQFKEQDWDTLAAHLQVSRAFLLQEVAWQLENNLSSVRAQMTKTGTGAPVVNTNNLPPPPSPGPVSPATPMTNTPRVTIPPVFEPRLTSALSVRSTTTPTPRGSPAPQQFLSNRRVPTDPLTTNTPRPVSRHRTEPLNTNRYTQNEPTIASSSKPHRFSNPVPTDIDASESAPPSECSTATSSEDDDDDQSHGRLIRRLPMFLKKQSSQSEDEEEPAFLPFSGTGTVTLPRPDALRRRVIDSAGPSSPSMGSSFSDLSDASVTQSAMEEAYLSTMQAGGIGSRISTIGHAMGSRYFRSQQ